MHGNEFFPAFHTAKIVIFPVYIQRKGIFCGKIGFTERVLNKKIMLYLISLRCIISQYQRLQLSVAEISKSGNY
jgi:hypothetical protein